MDFETAFDGSFGHPLRRPKGDPLNKGVERRKLKVVEAEKRSPAPRVRHALCVPQHVKIRNADLLIESTAWSSETDSLALSVSLGQFLGM